jgi:hypothetical protein
MRSQYLKEPAMAALGHEVPVEFAKAGGKTIGVLDLP